MLQLPAGKYDFPHWLSDGRLFCMNNGQAQIVLPGDDSGRAPESILLNNVREIAVSPDGKRIACEKSPPGGGRPVKLCLADMDRGDLTEIALPPGEDVATSSAWSADGVWLAFCRPVDKHEVLCICRVDGSGYRELTTGLPGNVSHPSWCPDGKTVVFSLQDSAADTTLIYRVNTNGSGAAAITTPGRASAEVPARVSALPASALPSSPCATGRQIATVRICSPSSWTAATW